MLHHGTLVQHQHYSWCCTKLPVHFTSNIPHLQQQSTAFWWEPMVSNHPSASWRSQTDEANWTTSSAKSRGTILRFPTQTVSSPQLHLMIMSMNITNRKRDKGQPWWRPTSAENVFDHVLLLGSHSDRMAHSHDLGTTVSPTGLPEGHDYRPSRW